MLSNCTGGTATLQQAPLLGSGSATAAHERNKTSITQHIPFKDIASDDYQRAFLRSGFEKIQPPTQIQVEPLPAAPETPAQPMQESKLVRVEVWNLLLGDEKQQLLEQARQHGSNVIPPQEEWPQWQVAVGGAENQQSNEKKQTLTFLIPPDFGKMRSGAKMLVELPNKGELSIARYAIN